MYRASDTDEDTACKCEFDRCSYILSTKVMPQKVEFMINGTEADQEKICNK